jgi:hypothetical protein
MQEEGKDQHPSKLLQALECALPGLKYESSLSNYLKGEICDHQKSFLS